MPTQPVTAIDTFPNPAPEHDYTIQMDVPEFTCLCPKTGQPDFATLELQYVPDRLCIELKSLKLYMLAYRNLGIFYENAVNRILRDIVDAAHPVWCVVRGDFTPRGGLTTSVEARWPRATRRAR